MPPTTPTTTPTPTPTPQPAPVPTTDTYPGKTLGIAGFVVSFFVSLVGMILSIVAFRQSRAVGHKNPLALAGIIIGAVFTVFGLIFGVIGILSAVSVINQCNTLGNGTHDVNGTMITCNTSAGSSSSTSSDGTDNSSLSN